MTTVPYNEIAEGLIYLFCEYPLYIGVSYLVIWPSRLVRVSVLTHCKILFRSPTAKPPTFQQIVAENRTSDGVGDRVQSAVTMYHFFCLGETSPSI